MTSSTHALTTVPQIHLPGQAAAPEGPVDMAMMYLMHHAFRRDLDLLAAAVPATPVEASTAWRGLEQRWALFSEALHRHHSEEDTWLWPVLLERASRPEQALLRAMEDEHGEIDPLLETCRDGFATMVAAPSADVRAALAVRLAATRESLARHLAHEETETIALLQRVLTQSDWDEIEAHFEEDLTLAVVVRLAPWVLQGVPADVRSELFAKPKGAGYRLVWWLTRRRFARRHAVAFAHLPGA